jgi:hypothetical protein
MQKIGNENDYRCEDVFAGIPPKVLVMLDSYNTIVAILQYTARKDKDALVRQSARNILVDLGEEA